MVKIYYIGQSCTDWPMGARLSDPQTCSMVEVSPKRAARLADGDDPPTVRIIHLSSIIIIIIIIILDTVISYAKSKHLLKRP